MNKTLKDLLAEVRSLYEKKGYGYITAKFDLFNYRQLQALKKLADTLCDQSGVRQRYLDTIQKTKVDALVQTLLDEHYKLNLKKVSGSVKHKKKFSR